MTDAVISGNKNENVVLVIGACTLDRILTVEAYPQQDSKIATKPVLETGGGNAANTAVTLSHLSSAQLGSLAFPLKVKLLTKLGDDCVRDLIHKELTSAGVDLSCDLFLKGKEGCTSNVTTVIVSEKEHTRTCLFTPGTCGEIYEEDVNQIIEKGKMDQLFKNVIHFHSDSRHTKAVILLAKEARKRNIPVSIDVERDRGAPMDSLLELATMVFTDKGEMSKYMERQRSEWRARNATIHDFDLNPSICLFEKYCTNPHTMDPGDLNSPQTPEVVATSANLKYHLYQRYNASLKDLIITRGEQGSIFIKHVTPPSQCEKKEINEDISYFHFDDDKMSVKIHDPMFDGNYLYHNLQLTQIGVLRDIKVVDTTGAGDTFIGGYIYCSILKNLGLFKGSCIDEIKFCLKFSSWVAGKKIQYIGAQRGIPNGQQVDNELGTDVETVASILDFIIPS